MRFFSLWGSWNGFDVIFLEKEGAGSTKYEWNQNFSGFSTKV